MRIIDTQMRTMNDPEQAAKMREALQKSKQENSKKLKCFTEELESSKDFNKLHKDVLERQTMSEIDIFATVNDSETTFPHLEPLKALGEREKSSRWTLCKAKWNKSFEWYAANSMCKWLIKCKC